MLIPKHWYLLIKSLFTKYIKETGALPNLDTVKQIHLSTLRQEVEDFVGFLNYITSCNATWFTSLQRSTKWISNHWIFILKSHKKLISNHLPEKHKIKNLSHALGVTVYMKNPKLFAVWLTLCWPTTLQIWFPFYLICCVPDTETDNGCNSSCYVVCSTETRKGVNYAWKQKHWHLSK